MQKALLAVSCFNTQKDIQVSIKEESPEVFTEEFHQEVRDTELVFELDHAQIISPQGFFQKDSVKNKSFQVLDPIKIENEMIDDLIELENTPSFRQRHKENLDPVEEK